MAEPSHLEVGKALYQENRVDEAIQQLQLAKREPRCRAEAGYFLAQAFGIKKRVYALAVKELEEARSNVLDDDTLGKSITYLLGRLHEAARRPGEACSEYEKLLGDDGAGSLARLRPTDPPRVPPKPDAEAREIEDKGE